MTPFKRRRERKAAGSGGKQRHGFPLAAVAFLLCGCVPLLPSLAARAGAEEAIPWPPTALDRALAAELARATTGLVQEGYPPPYYIGLRAADVRFEEYRCSMGGLRTRNAQNQRILTVDVHVGSRELDNHPMSPSNVYDARELPIDGDEFSMRHEIWQEMDDHYKNAAADFLRKEATRVRRGKVEYDTDDWTREDPVVADVPDGREPEAGAPDPARLCADLSAVFREKPALLNPRVTLEVNAATKRFFDSAGARVRQEAGVVRLALEAEALTADGMREFASRSFMEPRLSDLPPRPALEAAARELAADLEALRAASSTSPISAPALVDPSIGAALLEALSTRLAGEQQRNPEGAQTFRGRIGKRVLPAFLTLVDDPLRAEFRGRRLVGRYEADDQGVRARPVTLAEHGILKNYLLSRYPVLGFSKSNGHGRAAVGRQAMGRGANLFLTSEAERTERDLVELLQKECRRQGKPFGLWIGKARAWRQQDTTSQQQAFRLMPTLVYLVDARTGARSLVRDLDMVGTPLALLEKILAVGDDAEAHHAFIEDASGTLPISVVTPTLLLEEVELQRAETKPEKPLILPPPPP